MQNVKFTKLAGIALLVALALSLGVGEKVAQAQTLFGLAHDGPDGPSTLYRINPATGGFDPVGSDTGFQRCSGMDFDADGTLFATCELDDGSDTHVLITIDPSTGEGTGAEVGPTGIELLTGAFGETFTTATDISFRDSDGALFAYLKRDQTTGFSDHLATIDIGSAAATLKGFGFTLTSGIGNGIAFSPGDELFHADEDRLNTLDQDSGIVVSAVSLMFPATECPNQSDDFDCRVNAMDFNPDGILFASVNHKVGSEVENFLATIDTTTGVVAIKGPTVDGLDAIAFAPAGAAGAGLGDFKCYKVKRAKGTPEFEEVEVTLDDEFEPETKITRVRKPERFCTPVSKDGGDIPDPTASLTCYKIKDAKGQPKFERQDVVVKNQFGDEQALTLKKAEVLCVPSMIVP